jgi:hypothetical protein
MAIKRQEMKEANEEKRVLVVLVKIDTVPRDFWIFFCSENYGISV